MKKNAEAGALLEKLFAEFESLTDDILGQSSLVSNAFVEAQPEGAGAPEAEQVASRPVHSGRPAFRIRIPGAARSRLSAAERKEATIPADASDPEVLRLLTGLNRYHLWLMADVVGAVSEYYRSLFEVLGYLDPEIWPCSIYGDLRMPEVGAKSLAWFEERAAGFVESHGMVAVVDALTAAVPAIKHGAEVKTSPGVWFRGSDLILKLTLERHGSVSKATREEWLRGVGIEANEALRVLGVSSCISVRDEVSTLWLIDASHNAPELLTKRFESLLGKAQECARAGHAAAMEYFGCTAMTSQPQPGRQQSPQPGHHIHAKTLQHTPDPVQAPAVPAGKNPSFIPIKLQEPAGRYRAVK